MQQKRVKNKHFQKSLCIILEIPYLWSIFEDKRSFTALEKRFGLFCYISDFVKIREFPYNLANFWNFLPKKGWKKLVR